jgi:NAD(P)-dependent dehydrogenase (short-subunit alcohol dehydrogenase family)
MNYLLTGATRGIGLELASQLLTQGHYVTVTARNPESSKDLMVFTREYATNCQVLSMDVDSRQSIDSAIRQVKAPYLDVVINCAGVLKDYDSNLENLNLQDLEDTFRTNVLGPVAVSKACLSLLKKSSSPQLVNITSLMGSLKDNSSGLAYAYRMSKTALNMFSKNLSIDEKWLKVLMIHPGWVQTDMGGKNALLTTRDSVNGILKLINSPESKSGHFYSFAGTELAW